jgi:hypothetical protein
MSEIILHTIVVTGYGRYINMAHDEAVEIFPWVSPIGPPCMNGNRSFFIPPDGSKTGWEESHLARVRRRKYLHWLRTYVYEDGSHPLRWLNGSY